MENNTRLKQFKYYCSTIGVIRFSFIFTAYTTVVIMVIIKLQRQKRFLLLFKAFFVVFNKIFFPIQLKILRSVLLIQYSFFLLKFKKYFNTGRKNKVIDREELIIKSSVIF